MTQGQNNQKSKNPIWFKILNLAFLLPVLLWPLILFTTAFLFDNPKNFMLTFLLFIVINAYPLYLVLLLLFNAKLFEKNKVIATIFPIVFSWIFLTSGVNFFGGLSTITQLWSQIGAKPHNDIDYENVIGFNYRKDSTHIYYGGIPLPNADMKSFRLINFRWAKDTNRIYYMGEAMMNIDSKTFRYLASGYSVDTNNVYYDTIIIKGADAITFKYIPGTEDGKDKNYRYRRGILVDSITSPNETK